MRRAIVTVLLTVLAASPALALVCEVWCAAPAANPHAGHAQHGAAQSPVSGLQSPVGIQAPGFGLQASGGIRAPGSRLQASGLTRDCASHLLAEAVPRRVVHLPHCGTAQGGGARRTRARPRHDPLARSASAVDRSADCGSPSHLILRPRPACVRMLVSFFRESKHEPNVRTVDMLRAGRGRVGVAARVERAGQPARRPGAGAPARDAAGSARRARHDHSLFTGRDNGGTGWTPARTPMLGAHRQLGPWDAMIMGNAFVQYLEEFAPDSSGCGVSSAASTG